MNVTVFSILTFERPFLEQANAGRHQLQLYEAALTDQPAPLALARHLRQADQPPRANDFCLDQLIGFELHGKTVGTYLPQRARNQAPGLPHPRASGIATAVVAGLDAWGLGKPAPHEL